MITSRILLVICVGITMAGAEDQDVAPVALNTRTEKILSDLERKVTTLQTSLNKVYMDAITSLEKEQKEIVKTGDLKGALAVGEKIDELKRRIIDPISSDADLAARQIIGKWRYERKDGFTTVFIFKENGTVSTVNGGNGKWEKTNNAIRANFGGAWNDWPFPLSPKMHCNDSAGGVKCAIATKL